MQGKLWSVAPEYWSEHFEPYFLPLYKEALAQLNLSEDSMLLDAGCGSGLFSAMAIAMGADVIGIDAAPGLLAIARERNPLNIFMEEDLEALPFTNESFHVVAGFNTFQYAGSFENALIEAKRVLKPNGRLVIGIWDKPEMSDATNVLKAISTLLPPPPAGTPGPFALSEDGKIEQVIDKLGLKLNYKAKVVCPFYYTSKANGIKSFMGTGPAAAAMNYNEKDRVEETISKALKPFRIIDDFYYLQNQFLLFIAENE